MASASAVFVNQKAEIGRLAQFVDRFGEEQHLSADDVMSLNLVLDEVVMNIINHGYDDAGEHQIPVTLALDGDVVTIRVEDDGRPFNPLDAPPPNLDVPIEERQVGGLGIHIVRSVMDDVEHRRDGGRNVLIMKKTIGKD